MKKNCIAIILCSLAILALTGCGISEKSEDEILEDIKTEDYMLYNYDLEVTNFEITKRQTNDDDKEDFVWCSIEAENDYFTYENEFELEYVLYNDGWLLEESNFNYSMRAYTLKENVTMIDEDTLIQDIMTEDDCFDIYGLEVTSIEVYDADFPTATEWEFIDEPTGYWDSIYYDGGINKWYQVDVEAENDEFTYYNSYTISYEYDYDMWELYQVEGVESCDYKPLNYDAVAQADADVVASSQGYGSIQFENMEASDKMIVFTYYATDLKYHLLSEYNVTIYYQYNMETGWQLSNIKSYTIDKTLDIVGEWYYSDEEREFYANIIDFDLDEKWIEVELYLRGAESWYASGGIIKTNGVETKSLGQQVSADTKYEDLYIPENEIWIYCGKEKHLTESDGSGLSVDGYFLTKIS